MRPSPEPHRGEPDLGAEDLELTQLSVGELFLIWSLRIRLAQGPSGPVAGFRLAFGLSGVEAALAAFEGFFGVLHRHCRHAIGMHRPRCHCISPDELALVGVIAALQAGTLRHAHAMAARLVEAGAVDGFLGHAGDLAMRLRRERLHLPVRPPAGRDGSRPASIH